MLVVPLRAILMAVDLGATGLVRKEIGLSETELRIFFSFDSVSVRFITGLVSDKLD